MKKVLVLMLVLGMASLANAAFVSNINLLVETGGTIGIVMPDGMGSTLDLSGGYFFVTGVDPLSGALTASAPDASGLLGNSADFGFDPGVLGSIGSYATVWSIPAGTQVVTGLVKTDAVVRLYTLNDDFTNPVLRAAIPEPATMAILGLGALLLRRKK